jgi:nicotinate-nucleotide adenylyltransferase
LPRRIGIFGGTFNPIHLGHLSAAEEIGDRLGLDRVLFIPSFLPPHKQEDDMPKAEERREMVRLAILGNPRFALSDIEIDRGGRSYTIDTIEELGTVHQGAEMFFMTGLDSFLEIRTWKEWQRLLQLCTFVVLSREGTEFARIAALGLLPVADADLRALDERIRREIAVRSGGMNVILAAIPRYEISSTDIRTRVRTGRSIKYLLPEAVEAYIIEHKFYA